MHLEVLPANKYVRDVNEIDPSRVMVGHGIGFSAILKRRPVHQSPSQIPLFQDLFEGLAKEKESMVQVEGWVVEVLPDNRFKVALHHLKLHEPHIVIHGSQIETHSSFRRSLRRHIAAN